MANVDILPELWVKGGGMGFFTVAEGWLNFGYLGVFVQLFVLGLVVRLLHELRKQGAGNFGTHFRHPYGVGTMSIMANIIISVK